MAEILTGMKILELSAFVAAPLAGLTLSQLGAEVIRIDPEGGGADIGRWPLSPEGVSLYWTGLNKGKRSLTLDLKSETGRQAVYELLRRSGPDGGILLTNLGHAQWLSYEALQKIRSDVILVSLTGHHDGAIAVDYTVNCATGIPNITGEASENAPVNSVMPVWDLTAGLHLALGVLAAERHRRQTGQGQHVRLALSDTAYAMTAHLGYLAQAQVSDEKRESIGNHIYGSFGIDLPTQDQRRVMVVALTKRQWHMLMTATGTADLMAKIAQTNDCDLDQEGVRYQNRDAIAEILCGWSRQKTLQEIAEAFDAHQICWGLYQNFQQMAHHDPRASLQNPMFQEIDQPGVGKIRAAGAALNFSAYPHRTVKPAPTPGADNDVIAGEYDIDIKEKQ